MCNTCKLLEFTVTCWTGSYCPATETACTIDAASSESRRFELTFSDISSSVGAIDLIEEKLKYKWAEALNVVIRDIQGFQMLKSDKS